MVEEEQVKKMSKKELLKLDEELALKLQAEEDEEERLAREKAQKVKEANIAWDDIQAKIRDTLFVTTLREKKKYFAAKKARGKEETNHLTNAQQRRSIDYLSEKHDRIEAQRLKE
ncbi:hypothetical protein Tco_1326956 [Tanacetum coccineum]